MHTPLVKPRGITRNGGRPRGAGTGGRPSQVTITTTIDPRLLRAVKASGRKIVEVVQTCIGRDFPGWEGQSEKE